MTITSTQIDAFTNSVAFDKVIETLMVREAQNLVATLDPATGTEKEALDLNWATRLLQQQPFNNGPMKRAVLGDTAWVTTFDAWEALADADDHTLLTAAIQSWWGVFSGSVTHVESVP